MYKMVIIDQILKRKPTVFGSACHIILPKECKNSEVLVLISKPNHYELKLGRTRNINEQRFKEAILTKKSESLTLWLSKQL